jgi:hypothetical protein
VAGVVLAIPSVFTAHTSNVYDPGINDAKVTACCFEGADHVESTPSIL